MNGTISIRERGLGQGRSIMNQSIVVLLTGRYTSMVSHPSSQTLGWSIIYLILKVTYWVIGQYHGQIYSLMVMVNSPDVGTT